MESKVPATAVANVCATARNTVRRKPADRSGGKSPIKKFHTAAAVAGLNKTPGRISANRQEKSSSATATITYRMRLDIIRECRCAELLSNATESVLEVVAIALPS
jgi:hypothetical protein